MSWQLGARVEVFGFRVVCKVRSFGNEETQAVVAAAAVVAGAEELGLRD